MLDVPVPLIMLIGGNGEILEDVDAKGVENTVVEGCQDLQAVEKNEYPGLTDKELIDKLRRHLAECEEFYQDEIIRDSRFRRSHEEAKRIAYHVCDWKPELAFAEHRNRLGPDRNRHPFWEHLESQGYFDLPTWNHFAYAPKAIRDQMVQQQCGRQKCFWAPKMWAPMFDTGLQVDTLVPLCDENDEQFLRGQILLGQHSLDLRQIHPDLREKLKLLWIRTYRGDHLEMLFDQAKRSDGVAQLILEDKAIVLEAVSRTPYVFRDEFLSDTLRNDREVALAALKSEFEGWSGPRPHAHISEFENGSVKHIGDGLKEDRAFLLEALDFDGSKVIPTLLEALD